MNSLRSALNQRVVIADGAMGTMLQAQNPSLEDFQNHEGCNEILNVTRPEIVKAVHAEYLVAGVDAIETNTFGCKGDTVFKPIISIVPVEFLSFDAKRVNERVNLTWVTASEINNSHFDVERSIDNNRFEFIGTVKGNGTTSLMNTYRLVDNIKSLINTNVTTVYYRLKQVDYDGEFAYTDVRTVELNNLDAVELTVYPNPNYGVFNLSVKSTEKLITTFTIYDNIGAEVWSYTTTLEQGLNTIPAQLQLAKGMYNVSMLNNKGIQTQRFIVK